MAAVFRSVDLGRRAPTIDLTSSLSFHCHGDDCGPRCARLELRLPFLRALERAAIVIHNVAREN